VVTICRALAVVALADSYEGTILMLRRAMLLFFAVASMTMPFGGCRSCSSCHDYDPPVANCHGNACGCQRSGSVSGGGHVDGGYVSEGYVDDGYESGIYETAPPATEPATEQPAAQQ
jgi:hypothetical protein